MRKAMAALRGFHVFNCIAKLDGLRGTALVVDATARTRREVIFWTHGAVATLALLPSSLRAAEGRKLYTNLEEAREAGEALRAEKERAEGAIISLPSGVRFREIEQGSGRTVAPGDVLYVHYIVYRLNGMYLDSLGYGKEGKDDVGETLSFEFGRKTVPKAVELGMEGMKVGGRRRILVSPDMGWTSESLLPQPTTSAAQRRLSRSLKQPLLFEVEVVKANKPQQQ